MDKVRDAIRAKLRELGISDSEASRRIGQHRGYVHEVLSGKQATIPYEVRITMSQKLAIAPSKLGIQTNVADSTTARTSGLHEDADPYYPPAGSILTKSDAIGYFRQTSNVLENHPLKIRVDDLLAFNLTQAAIDGMQSEKIVLLQCYPRDTEILSARTLIREYIRPGLLVTNRRSRNEIFSLDDPNLPFEAVIKGVLQSLVRE